jgi:hypothetical protein
MRRTSCGKSDCSVTMRNMSLQTVEPRADDFGGHAVYLDWDTEFIPWASGKLRKATAAGMRLPLPSPWKPGGHWALIGPTGEGKSTFAVGILGLRKWVLSLDPKGEDETLESSGYQRLTTMPPPHDRLAAMGRKPREGTDEWIWDRVAKGLSVGLIAGFEAMTDEEDAALHALMKDSVIWCRRTRGWTLYVDEFELLSSQRMFRLGPDIERMLITARRAGTSVVTSFQAAAWVSKHATRQASFTSLWPTRDRQMIKNVAEAMGRDWRMIAQAIDELPPFHTLTIPKQIRAPMIITTAPKRS